MRERRPTAPLTITCVTDGFPGESCHLWSRKVHGSGGGRSNCRPAIRTAPWIALCQESGARTTVSEVLVQVPESSVEQIYRNIFLRSLPSKSVKTHLKRPSATREIQWIM
jgi:hypothetical protein